jgi:hypothetical protein
MMIIIIIAQFCTGVTWMVRMFKVSPKDKFGPTRVMCQGIAVRGFTISMIHCNIRRLNKKALMDWACSVNVKQ